MSTHVESNYDRILEKIREILGNAIPNAESIDLHLPFLEMGANSLVLMDVQRTIDRDFGVTISIGQFFEELTTIDALIHYIDCELSQLSVSAPVTPDPADPQIIQLEPVDISGLESTVNGVVDAKLQSLFQTQIQTTAHVMQELIRRQLHFLNENKSLLTTLKDPDEAPQGITQRLNGSSESKSASEGSSNPASGVISQAATASAPTKKTDRPGSAIQPQKMLSALETRARGLTDQQQNHLESLIREYTQKTAKSKAHTAKYRKVLSDSRAAIGFRFTTKEMLYPIVSDRSKGARIWDLDGNEYLDISMGQGVTMFGHHPEFIESELKKMVESGVEMGPRPDHVGEVARILTEMTGFERVTFTNSGTEAVMAAMRLARASTGRDKIVSFEGAWHGHADSVMGMLVEETDGHPITKPVSPGTPMGAVADQFVLKFNDPDSLDFIKRHGASIAAILVEPVQSRNPSVQPREFLHQLRSLSTEIGALLIFDEMITGFRSHPGGAQAWFDVKADMATYGKVIGGGLPIGVVAGPAWIMDRIDGGHWEYGDTSYPEVSRVVFGGTFCQHPLAMTASLATLHYLLEKGPALQEELNQRTTRMANELNEWFEQEEVPIQVSHFASLFRFEFNTNLELLFYHMNLRGVFVWEWRNCFLSTAHTDKDIRRVIEVVKESVIAMREGGFIPPKGNATGNEPSNKGSYKRSLQESSSLNSSSENSITPSTHSQTFPLSQAQAQLAALAELSEAGSRAYHVGALLKLTGVLDDDALNSALQILVKRHDSLRSTIQQASHQVIHPETIISLSITDLRKSKKPEAAFEKWLDAQAEVHFDLSEGPLFKAEMVHLSDNDHRLSLKAHHIILDGLSMNLIVQELSEAYNAIIQGQKPADKETFQFREYLNWQNSNTFEKEKTYWNSVFPDGLPALELPSRKSRPSQPSYTGGRISTSISESVFASVRTKSAKEGLTPFMFLLSVYSLWLHRLTGQQELVVGMPVAGRSVKGAESLVGYATHVIPIRSTFKRGESVREYMKRMRSVLLNGYQHQDYPFSRLMKDFSETDSQYRTRSAVRAIFNLDRPGKAPEFDGLTVEWQSQPVHYTAFDWVMNLTEVEDSLHMECDYNADLMDRETANLYSGSFLHLLDSVVDHLDMETARVPLISDTELSAWQDTHNSSDSPISETCTVVSLLNQQYDTSKTSVALSWKEGSLTYSDIHAKVDQLAGYILQRGLKKGQLVAIYLKRSPEMVTSILAVLKAGGGFLPIDTNYPASRVEDLLSDAEPTFLIQDSTHAEVPARPAPTQLIDLKVWAMEQETISEEKPSKKPSQTVSHHKSFKDENLDSSIQFPEISHDDLAYCLYTSGSTGKPKGVLISHGGFVNYLMWAATAYEMDKGIGAPLHASMSFDATLTSLFTPLIRGKMVYLLPDDGNDVVQLAELLSNPDFNNWSLLKVTPSHLEFLNAQIPENRFKELTRTLVLGGEALYDVHIEPWITHSPKTAVYNEYGPTETVVGCAVFKADAAWFNASNRTTAVPIGRPINHTRLFILDANLEPLPYGVPGELFIAGAGVAKGYFRRDALTNEKFIPVSDTGLTRFKESILKPNDRLYRTGDRCVILPDGELLFLGRFDEQIKLRGYRIEPEEIKVALLRNPKINEAFVTLFKGESAPKIVAYYTADQPILDTEISDELREQLPSYMVPAAYVHLSSFPLTKNGKLDTKALPDPHVSRKAEAQVNPENSTEEKLITIWKELLEKEEIGTQQNFFDMGGHSLLVIPMMEKIKEVFQVDIKAAQIFQYPSIRLLSEYVTGQSEERAGLAGKGVTNQKEVLPTTRKKRRASVVRITKS